MVRLDSKSLIARFWGLFIFIYLFICKCLFIFKCLHRIASTIYQHLSLIQFFINFHSPLPKYRWEYQGIGLRSRWLSTSSNELNFEFFRIKGGGHSLGITRITRLDWGPY